MDTSYLTSQVATIIGQLHGLFDEIGVAAHERDSREAELFSALSETLNNQLRLVASEKSEMTEEANRIIKIIRQMEASLDDNKADHDYELEPDGMKVTYPLTRCLQGLKEKHASVNKLHKERFEQVKKLVQALESYASHMESSLVQVPLPPTGSNASVPPTFNLSPSYVNALDNEFTRIYEEYTRRVSTVRATSEDIIKLWAELGTPQAQTDSAIVKYYRDSPEQLGLHEEDLGRLRGKRDKLVEEKRGREKHLKELKDAVESLWERLGVEIHDRKGFLNGNRGCGLRVINEFEDELARLNELKRQNLHLFVEDARYKLQELWDGLYFSEEEMLEFTPAFSDVYSDALLSAHEGEIARLEALKEQRAPSLQLIDKHRSLIKDREDLAASSQDASRLMMKGQKGEKRDPTRLLREEKMRKRIAKDLPKIEVELRRTLERWENEYGRPFLVHGERYLDEIVAAATKPLPPRSKTPSGPPPSSARTNKSFAASQRGPPGRGAPSRNGAKTPMEGTRRGPLASSTSTLSTKSPSPSKIPSRKPLGPLTNGNNSPERRGLPHPPAPAVSQQYESSHKMGPPSMAPPPRMRDLYSGPSTATPQQNQSNGQRTVSGESSAGSVRYVSPDDVYDDRERMSYLHSSAVQQQNLRNYNSIKSGGNEGYPQQGYPKAAAGSRQISTTSTATNTVSGSENWETYEDTSDGEADLREAYQDRLRAARGKRFTPEGGHGAPSGGHGKRLKGIRGVGNETLMEEYDGQPGRVPSGSEAGWADYDDGL